MTNILSRIVEYKRDFIFQAKQRVSLNYLKSQVSDSTFTSKPQFVNAIKKKTSQGLPAIIAEVKKGSPSMGVIRQNFDPVFFAKQFEDGGATCLSVLTDEKFFFGSVNNIIDIKKEVSIPILRKDFIIDEYQILESKIIGADAVLLILSCLDKSLAVELERCAIENGLDVLCECHNEEEVDFCISNMKTDLIGINNRDLSNFSTSFDPVKRLFAKILPDSPKVIVSESGISSASDLKLLFDLGIRAFLIGTYLTKANNPSECLRELLV